MNKTTRLKKPQIPELETLYTFDELGGRPKYGGVEMTSETDIPSFQEIMDETHSAVVAEATARDDADDALQAEIDALAGQTSEALENEATARAAADTVLQGAINSEASTRGAADNVLQTQIDAIVASSDVKDIVGTKAELDAYDKSTLGDNDIIKVLQDESQANATTYYRYIEATDSFTLIGSEGPYYTKGQADTLLNAKADKATTYTKAEVDTALAGKQNELTAGTGIDITNDVISVTNAGPTVVQTTGTSTTDVMSQNAVTSMVYADPATRNNVKIGRNTGATGYYSIAFGFQAAAQGNNNIAIGRNANVDSMATNAVAIGEYSLATAKGQFDISALGNGSSATEGYNNSAYRLLTGLYDPQSAHDAANKEYVDNLAVTYAALNGTAAPTTATAGTYVGQLYLDTTNDKMYYLASIDSTADPVEYNWLEVGGGPNVVQTVGTSTTDVMSQKAVTGMIYKDPDTRRKISLGGVDVGGANAVTIGSNSVCSGGYAVALGSNANAHHKGSVALGSFTATAGEGTVNIGPAQTPYGYNNSNYRLLTGLYDPQSDHDAATKGYVDTAVTAVDTPDEFTSSEWNTLWA